METDDQLEAVVCDLVARKKAAKPGSAERAFLIRQLRGIAKNHECGPNLISYWDEEWWEVGLY